MDNAPLKIRRSFFVTTALVVMLLPSCMTQAFPETPLEDVILRDVVIEDASVSEVIRYLQSVTDSSRQANLHVSVISLLPRNVGSDARITLSLNKISMFDLIRHICKRADLKYRVNGSVITLGGEAMNDLTSRSFVIKPKFLHTIAPSGDLETYFMKQGVTFPEGTHLHYDFKRSTLHITNNLENIVRIKKIIFPYAFGRFAKSAMETRETLRRIHFESLEFDETPLDVILEYVRVKSRQNDPRGEGLSIIVDLSEETVRNNVLSLYLHDISAETLLSHLCQAAGLEYELEGYVIVIKDSQRQVTRH